MSDKIYYVKYSGDLFMRGPRYKFKEKAPGNYALYENGRVLVKVKRESFQEDMSAVGRSSNWVGCMLRLLNETFPSSIPPYVPPLPLQDAVNRYGETGLVDYLRNKGLRVVKPLKASDREIVGYLESRGWIIDGLLGDSYYSTEENGEKSFFVKSRLPEPP
jgi:hypothetical protein